MGISSYKTFAGTEERLGQIGMQGLFPLWGRDTGELAREFIELGFRAVVCCVDPRTLGERFCGMEYDGSFLESLPSGVDPCGENGEFHTFVYAGPIFKNEIAADQGINSQQGRLLLRRLTSPNLRHSPI